MDATAQQPVLQVRDLRTHFHLEEGTLKAVDGVSFSLGPNRTLGIVGESGCGKSVTVQTIMGIVGGKPEVQGSAHLQLEDERVDLLALPRDSGQFRRIRGQAISMIFQEPMTSFSPVHTAGFQIMEAIQVHRAQTWAECRPRALELLQQVGIPNPEANIDAYPHQLSGGMRQRAMIAMALALHPRVLVADEPTTALDVTIQAQILRLMKNLQAELGMSILFITHDLGVIAHMADEVLVMYLGRVVEYTDVKTIFSAPQHPYTQALMASIPRVRKLRGERLHAIRGSVPVALNPPACCAFAPRCPDFMPGRCDVQMPELVETAPGHKVRCFLFAEDGG